MSQVGAVLPGQKSNEGQIRKKIWIPRQYSTPVASFSYFLRSKSNGVIHANVHTKYRKKDW